MNLSDFTIPTPVYWGAGLMALAFALLFVVAKGIGGGRMLRVPDGVPVDKYFRDWKKSALSKRIGRRVIFVAFLAAGLMLGGCGAVVIGFVAS
jgi:hypothetical protein